MGTKLLQKQFLLTRQHAKVRAIHKWQMRWQHTYNRRFPVKGWNHREAKTYLFTGHPASAAPILRYTVLFQMHMGHHLETVNKRRKSATAEVPQIFHHPMAPQADAPTLWQRLCMHITGLPLYRQFTQPIHHPLGRHTRKQFPFHSFPSSSVFLIAIIYNHIIKGR